jgi:hypothetical protein
MIKFLLIAFIVLCGNCVCSADTANSTLPRRLNTGEVDSCDSSVSTNPVMKRYFNAMDSIYSGKSGEGTCYPVHKACGWPRTNKGNNLPLFVLSVGLEGAGHHLWTEILEQPVFDCVWKNARHYYRDIADGVPRGTAQQLRSGFLEQFELRHQAGKPPCKTIYDSEDSFPTGAIRANGRIFMRPDIINLQQLDGVMFNVKYLLILRNTTVPNPQYECLRCDRNSLTTLPLLVLFIRTPRCRLCGGTSSPQWTPNCAPWSTR